jgi:hypothetical protein
MNRLLSIAAAGLVIMLAGATCGADEDFPVVHNEPITVRILSGGDGTPQARLHVLLAAGYDHRDLKLGLWHEEAATDSAGEVRLSMALRNLPLLRVEVLKRHACAPDPNEAAISVERIRRDGLSSANRCGTFALADAPSVLTVFVKAGKTAKEGGRSTVPIASTRP